MKQFNSILRLRRDNHYNYEKIKDTFIPANGEVCLVDTLQQGLCAIIGDGIRTFGELNYVNQIFIKGYYNNGSFYEDKANELAHIALINRIYIDLNTSKLYHYDGEKYQPIGTELPTANSIEPGIMKLYNEVGNNTDGTMTQKAITDELSEKFEIALNIDEELLIFTQD